jgi:hypothetical protein
MDEASEKRLFRLLDTIAVEVGKFDEFRAETRAGLGEVREELRAGFADIRAEMRTGFAGLDRRLGHVETRIEGLEGETRPFRAETTNILGDHERRITSLESPQA